MAKRLKFKKSLDPKEKFPVVALVRGETAKELNDYLEDWDRPKKKEFTLSDPRLTKEVMEFLAKKQGEYLDLLEEPGCTQDGADDFWAEALYDALGMMGIEPKEE